jgi:hypothetical protein
MTTTDIEQPSVLRETITRLGRKAKRQEAQIDRLTRMLLLERLKDGDIDFADGLDLMDHYRPKWVPGAFDDQFSIEACTAWLAARRGP